MARNIDEDFEKLDRDGYVILDRLLSESYCDEIVSAFDRIEAEHDIKPMEMDFAGRNTTRIFNLLQYDDIFQDIPLNPAYLGLAERYIDRECLMSAYDSSTIGPGEPQQPIHADNWWLDGRRFDFPFMLGTIFCLTDFTEANGATNLVPGTHKWTAAEISYESDDPDYKQVPGGHPAGYGTRWTPIIAEAPKGSVIVYDVRLLHGAGANRTNERRPSIIMNYIQGWMRQCDNFIAGTEMEKLRSFPPRLQQLCGLGRYRGHFGHVNNMDPTQWLFDRPAQRQLVDG